MKLLLIVFLELAVIVPSVTRITSQTDVIAGFLGLGIAFSAGVIVIGISVIHTRLHKDRIA